MQYAHIVGWGCYRPQRVLSNDDLAKIVNTSDDWIRARTGIRQRHIASEQENTATMAFEAAAAALAIANIHPSQIGLIIVATSTPGHMFPSVAAQVQDRLGATRAGAFDLSAACSGFVYALDMATHAIAAGSTQKALVIGAETMSRVLDWQDRGTCILFGDGAGAVVLEGSSIPGGVMASTLRADGSGGDLLKLPIVYKNETPTLRPDFHQNGYYANTISMNGRQVFRFAVKVIADSVREVLERSELTIDDIALIIPHQANVRIIEAAAKRLKINTDKFFLNVARSANTSAASIPLALCDAVKEGLLRPDDNVVFIGFGGGLTWGASLVKWDVTPPEEPRVPTSLQRAQYAVYARFRSKALQWGRKVDARLGGSPTPGASLDDAENQGDEQDKNKRS